MSKSHITPGEQHTGAAEAPAASNVPHSDAATHDAQGATPSKGQRVATGLREFFKFGVVGGSGVVVNLLVFYLAKKALDAGWDLHEADALVAIPGTRFNVRWYHVMSTIAFLLANVWNYQLNRSWTFRKLEQRNWFAGFFPFLATGGIAFLVSLMFMTLFMNPNSPIALPDDILDDSTGFRTKSYWAQALSTLIAMPVNFIINKFWAFGKPKTSTVIEEAPR